MKLTLQARLVRFLAAHPDHWTNGAELGDRAHAAEEHCKHNTVSRRMRVLLRHYAALRQPRSMAAKNYCTAVFQRREMKGEYGRVASVWYRYVEDQLPQLKYQYVPKADGTVGSRNVGKRLRSSVDVKYERCTKRVLRCVNQMCVYMCPLSHFQHECSTKLEVGIGGHC